MSEPLKAGLFEDYSDWHRRIEQDLVGEGFTIVAEGWDCEESIEAINKAESMQAAFIDGNLNLNYQPERDGDILSRMLREKFGTTAIILVSISDGRPVKDADYDFPKKRINDDPQTWISFIRALRTKI